MTLKHSAPVLILTDNAVEAMDIAEAVQMRGIASYLHLRSAEEAEPWLTTPGKEPSCILVGLRTSVPSAAQLIATAAEKGLPLLVIADPEAVQDGLPVLQRPFTTETLDAALTSIGF